MPAQWVRPEHVRVLWIAYTDVTRHTLCEAFPGKDTKGTGHVRQDPRAMLVKGREKGYSRKTYTLRNGLKGRLFFRRVLLRFRNRLFGERDRIYRDDSGGCHDSVFIRSRKGV